MVRLPHIQAKFRISVLKTQWSVSQGSRLATHTFILLVPTLAVEAHIVTIGYEHETLVTESASYCGADDRMNMPLVQPLRGHSSMNDASSQPDGSRLSITD